MVRATLKNKEHAMLRRMIRCLVAPLAALALTSGAALAQMKVTVAIGGAGCLCYLPPVLAGQLGA